MAAIEFDRDGLPVHVRSGHTADCEGPTGDSEADHFACWCAQGDDCIVFPREDG